MNQNLKSLLKTLEKSRQEYWNIPRETGIFLNCLILTQNFKSVLEIGSSTGYSALWMAEALSHTKGHLTTIESHKKVRHKLAQENFAKSGLSKQITLIMGHAPEDLPKSSKKLDMVFLDATKNEHPSYFQALKSRVKKGGLIITDNFLSHRKELSPYLQMLKKEKGWISAELKIGSGLLISQKIS
ncbi:class I SAM-dependent methyltransferase [Candidatus Peregrinibacteria bacterium]|nr:class I SAM-dependent methyltransferase [Candidatus Peregrinibacteria bacterium]